MNNLTPLNHFPPFMHAVVRKVSGSGEVHQRLLDMGIVPGAGIEVQRVAPLGDPIEVKVKGYQLSLRKNEAANILVAAG